MSSMPEQENTNLLTKKLTRREFVQGAARLFVGLAAEEAARHLGLGLNSAEAARPEAGKEPQMDLPPNTYLTSLPDWQLKLFRRVPVETLELYNGPKSTWSLPESGGVFVVPKEYFDGQTGADNEAKEKLKKVLVVRADIARDEATDKGWGREELKLIQALIPLAIRRCEEFFGPSTWHGLVQMSRPSKTEREVLRNSMYEGVGGAVMGGPFGCLEAVDVGGCDPNNINIVILNSWGNVASGLGIGDKDREMQLFVGYIRNLLAHEVGHVWFGGTQLGTPGELGALDNHSIVYSLGASTILADLARKIVGKQPEELNIDGLSFNDMEKPEMVLWKAFKVRGREFYADLLKNLRVIYGDKNAYTTKEVSVVGNMLFQEVGFKFTYEDLLKSFNTIPDESKIQRREMDDYKYPVDRVKGDPMNTNGEVCWWEEVKTLSPVSFGAPGWFRGPIFPDDDGYYRAYKKIGKGLLKDGPPNKNSLAVATWKKGGGAYGAPTPFPPDLDGVEFIRAKNY